MTICGHQKRPQSKGQGKNRVRKTDQLKESGDGIRSRRTVFFDDHDSRRLAVFCEEFFHLRARAGKDGCSVGKKHAFESEFEKFAQ